VLAYGMIVGAGLHIGPRLGGYADTRSQVYTGIMRIGGHVARRYTAIEHVALRCTATRHFGSELLFYAIKHWILVFGFVDMIPICHWVLGIWYLVLRCFFIPFVLRYGS